MKRAPPFSGAFFIFMAGYSEKPLIKKLGLKDELKPLFLNLQLIITRGLAPCQKMLS
jgi:hypothetical protein